MITIYRFLLPALFILALSACTPPAKTPDPDTTTIKPEPQVQAWIDAGQYEQAAKHYQQRAQTLQGDARQGALLEAIHYWLLAQQTQRAEEILKQLTPPLDTAALQARYQLLRAQWQFQNEQAADAIQTLAALDPTALPAELKTQYFALQADAYGSLGENHKAIQSRLALDATLTDDQAAYENQKAIWNLLQGITLYEEQQLQAQLTPDLAAWLQLLQVVQTGRQSPEQFQSQLAAWRAQHPGAPISERLLEDIQGFFANYLKRPKSIAVAIPLSGRLKPLGQAIQNGLLSAYYQDSRRDIHLRFYDSNSTADIWMLYKRILDDGNELMIGPLLKERVEPLAQAGALDIPVLALNSVNVPNPAANLYQFGLLPEDEAAGAADRIIADGFTQALVLVPSNQLGERLAQAFDHRLRVQGGKVLGVHQYNPQQPDHSATLRAMLHLDQSELRYDTLRNSLNRKIEFEPRRRQDVQAIFVAATPEQARLLIPQLRFHRASDVPMYASSLVYTGTPNASLDRDLDGLTFNDIPWLLLPDNQTNEHPLGNLWPQQRRNQPRLLAMGWDAYQLVAELSWLAASPAESMQGLTGRLRLDPQRRVRRELAWARFINGQAQRLPDQQHGPAGRPGSGLDLQGYETMPMESGDAAQQNPTHSGPAPR